MSEGDMSIRLSYAIPLFSAAAICLVIAGIVWRQRLVKWISPYVVSLVAIALWCVANAMMALVQDPEHQLFWLNLGYLGITVISFSWLLFVLYYSGTIAPNSKVSRFWPFYLYPFIMNTIVWTDSWHHLFRAAVWVDYGALVPVIRTASGPFFYVHTAYSYALLLLSMVLLVRSAIRTRGGYRIQAIMLIVGATVPWLANLLFIAGVFPAAIVDLTPVSFALTGITAYLAFRRYGLVELIPIAQRILIEHMLDPVFILDAFDRVIDTNPAANIAFNVETDALIGTDIADLIPDYGQLIAQSREDLPLSLSLQPDPTQEPVFYNVRLHPLDGDSAERQGGLLVLRDVSTEQRALTMLSQYAERLSVLHDIDRSILAEELPEHIADVALEGLRNLLDYDTAVIFTRDGEDGCTVVSKKNQRNCDFDLAIWLDVVKHMDFSEGSPLQHSNMNSGNTTRNWEHALVATGVRGYLLIPMMITGTCMGVLIFEFTQPDAFTSRQFEIAVQVAASLSVTLHNASLRLSLKHELVDRQRAEMELRRKEAALSEYAADLEAQNAELDAFAHTVAHDIKQPLAQLLGYSTLLEGEYASLPEETFLLCVQAIARNSRKLSSITDELLLLASVRKLDDLDVKPLLMEDIIPDVLERLELIIAQSQAHITCGTQWPTVVAYAPWIEEVWTNYISNAIKYGDTPPEITLGWDLQPSQQDQRVANVRFWVRDNGQGLSSEEMERLFVPFERLDQVRVQGYGLGLSIVQRIITKLGGTVGVESNGCPGQGSLFYFSLPLPDTIPQQ